MKKSQLRKIIKEELLRESGLYAYKDKPDKRKTDLLAKEVKNLLTACKNQNGGDIDKYVKKIFYIYDDEFKH